jgi:trafficking protein particle complex subunit 3
VCASEEYSDTPSPNNECTRTRTDKINVEVLTLTYGTLVAQLCRDLTLPNTASRTDYAAVNTELDRMGYNIGIRLIEDFLAKTNSGQCSNFRETAEMIAKVGFKVFMNVTPRIENWDKEGKSFGLVFEENPLADWVELPDDGRAQAELWFSNILCGVIRGALEMVSRASLAWKGEMCTDERGYRSRCKSRRSS